MSSDPNLPPEQNNENDIIKQQLQQLQRSRRPNRRGQTSAGVGLTLPDSDDAQEALPGASPPGGPIYRGMAMRDTTPRLLGIPQTSASSPFASSLHGYKDHSMMSVNPSFQRKQEAADFRGQKDGLRWPPLQISNDVPFGWDMHHFRVQELPPYFPKDILKHEFPSSELEDVLSRVSLKLRGSSIQASFCNNPLSAKLQTCENVELYLVFFDERKRRRGRASSDTPLCFMSLQRHKGDQLVANRYVHEIVDAAKGLGVEDSGAEPEPFAKPLPGAPSATKEENVNADSLQSMERLIERVVESAQQQAHGDGSNASHPFTNQSPEQMITSAIQDISGWLEQSKRLDLRRHAMEYLLVMTDVKRTLSSSAIAGALVILQGKSPSGCGMDSQAAAIQSFVMTILQKRELPGDRDMFANMDLTTTPEPDNDLEMRPYFPEETSSPAGLPGFYIEYMNELFHMALQALVQSLEVVACFHQSLTSNQGLNIEEMAKQLLASDGNDIYTILIGCIGRAESKLSNGYLACKALRLLAMACPGLKEQLKLDENAKHSISNAYQIGQTCHSLLKDESFQLWETVRQ